MKDLSAGIVALVPAFILWRLGAITDDAYLYFISGAGAVVLCLLVYYLLAKWHHGGVLVFLTLGIPPMGYIFVAVRYPVFIPLFLVAAVIVLLTALTGAMISDTWSWEGIGINLAFMTTVTFVIIAFGFSLGVVWVESALMATGAFAITRLCEVDLLSWLALFPRRIYQGLENLWR
ncbi:MAG: hypothetical protein ACOX21_06120 [Bacillota bacterium]|nr:hypothetical protein [Bacillota bacterium]HOC06570.1 hypothetical protein [Bacillota bacterium]HPZ22902.1 hypothetical protein [Bacillota bacterium]HQD19903.1 hypothetical protein [Bacillota bacterium]